MSHSEGKNDEGAAAVEFAIVATLFLTLVLAIIGYGTYFAARLALSYAASEGARASIAGMNDSERQILAVETAQRVLDNYGLLIGYGPGGPAQIVAQPVSGQPGLYEVVITYDFSETGLGGLGGLVPLPNPVSTTRVIVSNGGY